MDWLNLALGPVSALVAAGIVWGTVMTRLGRVEKDVEQRATVERVNGIEKVQDSRHDGIEKKLDKIEDTLEAIRSELASGRGNTNPGRH